MKRALLLFCLAALPLHAVMISCPEPCCQPCWGVEVYGEYLYWKISEDQTQFAATIDESAGSAAIPFGSLPSIISTKPYVLGEPVTAAPLIEGLSLIDPDFKYDSGFRVGLGFNFGCCSKWLANVEYTRYYSTTKSHASAINGLFPIGYPLLPLLVKETALFGERAPGLTEEFPLAIENQFKFRYDAVDLQFGQLRQWGCFCARPYFGGKGAWIRQNSDTVYSGLSFISTVSPGTVVPVFASLGKKNDYKAGGLEVGFDSALAFWGNLAVTGGFQAALLYGHFDVESSPRFIAPTEFVVFPFPSLIGTVKTVRHNRVRPMIDAYLGLDWNTCFCSRWIFNVGAAWELQYFWNQWQSPSSVDATIFQAGDAPQGDLALQGLTVFASITF